MLYHSNLSFFLFPRVIWRGTYSQHIFIDLFWKSKAASQCHLKCSRKRTEDDDVLHSCNCWITCKTITGNARCQFFISVEKRSGTASLHRPIPQREVAMETWCIVGGELLSCQRNKMVPQERLSLVKRGFLDAEQEEEEKMTPSVSEDVLLFNKWTSVSLPEPGSSEILI